MIDYEKFEKSIKNLELQIQNYKNISARLELKDIDREAISESVIQRFEVCYDCLWKILKRYLREILGIPELPNSPKPLFRSKQPLILLLCLLRMQQNFTKK